MRKGLLLFLLMVALALGLAILYRQKSSIPLILFNVLADASLGLLIGLGTRFVLRQRNALIQGIASAMLSAIGLALLGYLTNWKSGIGPFQIGWVKENWLNWAHVSLQLPLQFGRNGTDLMDLADLVIAVDTSWIALRAWKRSSRISRQPAVSSPRPSGRSKARPARATAVSNVPVPKIRVPASIGTGSSARPIIKRKKSGRPMISRPSGSAFARPGGTRAKRWSPLRHKPEVQLAVYEEHRCPYCLEEVNRNDPRGVVECQVCHTLHHKDCWDITGSCQVPHLNT